MTEIAIQADNLHKRFGAKTVLQGVSFQVRRGRTFAFLGLNGQGKTTTIQILVGLLRPESGQASVLGMDPRRRAIDVRRRVGYMAEDQAMFGWMRVCELLDFMAPFYPTWDKAYALSLAGRFDLPPKGRVKTLSKGQNCRLSLLLAMAHRPEVMILDDPTLGLDPLMRRQFLRDVVNYLQDGGTTVFFSSHLLYEIEPVADEVAILHKGRILLQEPTEQLRNRVQRIVLALDDYRRLRPLAGELDVLAGPRQAAVVVGDAPAAAKALDAAGVDYQLNALNLDEIFEAHVAGQQEAHLDPKADLETVA